MVLQFSSSDVRLLQRALQKFAKLSRRDKADAAARVGEIGLPTWTLCPAPALLQDEALLDKLRAATDLHDYGPLPFFPELWPRFQKEFPKSPEICISAGPVLDQRGWVANFADIGVVVKPVQRPRETVIAAEMDSLGHGPKQLKTLPGYICEEYLPGWELTKLPSSYQHPAAYRTIGQQVGAFYADLHSKQIVYNDALMRENGESHIVVDETLRVRVFDFGMTVDLRLYPDLRGADVQDLVTVLPEVLLTWYVEAKEDWDKVERRLQRAVEREFKEILPTLAQLYQQDIAYIERNAFRGANFLRNDFVDHFLTGFAEGYPGYKRR